MINPLDVLDLITGIGDSVNFVKLNLSRAGGVGGFKRFYDGRVEVKECLFAP